MSKQVALTADQKRKVVDGLLLAFLKRAGIDADVHNTSNGMRIDLVFTDSTHPLLQSTTSQ